MADERFAFVVVSNRLPVDRVVADDGSASWTQSPGGLVTALEPVMRQIHGAWVGWIGQPGDDVKPFTHDGLRIVPVALSEAAARIGGCAACLHLPPPSTADRPP